VAALMRTTPADYSCMPPRVNEIAAIEYGLKTFIETSLADDTDRPPATDSEVTAMAEFNLLVEPSVRLSLMTRAFDYRGFLAGLSSRAQEKLTVVTPMGDRILQSAHTRALWPTGGDIAHLPIDREGHLFFWRAPDCFRPILAADNSRRPRP
jgi:hypothetical protein